MLLLQMDLKELFSLKGVGGRLFAPFEVTEPASVIIGPTVLGIDIDVMVVPNMLTKVILALESIFSSISAALN